MLTPEQKLTAQQFLASHPLAVIATADADATPGAAVVLFAETPELEIIFATHPTRKYQNLEDNHKAALVFSKDWACIQMHGTADELAGSELTTLKQLFISKQPNFDQHLLEGSVFFKFTPSWMRFMNLGPKPPVQWEVELTS
jgi:hypothetical protein